MQGRINACLLKRNFLWSISDGFCIHMVAMLGAWVLDLDFEWVLLTFTFRAKSKKFGRIGWHNSAVWLRLYLDPFTCCCIRSRAVVNVLFPPPTEPRPQTPNHFVALVCANKLGTSTTHDRGQEVVHNATPKAILVI